MLCSNCRHDNPASLLYCKKCGSKLDLTADEIHESILASAAADKALQVEENMRNAMRFAILILLIAIGLFLAAGQLPQGRVHLPSAADGADYVRTSWKYESKMEKSLVPFKTKGREP